MKYSFLPIILIFLIIKTSYAYSNPSFTSKHIYYRSYNNVYNAIIKYCKESNIDLEYSNIISGEIKTTQNRSLKNIFSMQDQYLFKLNKLNTFETELKIILLNTTNNPYQSRYPIQNIIDSIHFNTGTSEITHYLLNKYASGVNDPVIVFNYSSLNVKLWDSKIIINNSPEKYLRIKSGEFYEITAPQGNTIIKYYLRSNILLNNNFNIYQTGDSPIGSIYYKTITISLKKGDLVVFNIVESNMYTGLSCLPLCLSFPLPFPVFNNYIDVSFINHKLN